MEGYKSQNPGVGRLWGKGEVLTLIELIILLLAEGHTESFTEALEMLGLKEV